jgi:tetratricopeptide (TPR) repeat protein
MLGLKLQENTMLKAFEKLGYAFGAILSAIHNPGRSKLAEGKRCWQSLGLYVEPVFRFGVANTYVDRFRNHAQVARAEQLIQESIDFIDESISNSADAMSNKALAFQELGLLYRATNDFEKATSAYASAIKILERYGGATSTNKRILSAYRETCFRVGELSHTLGDYGRSADFYSRCLEVDAKFGHDQPIDEQITRDLLHDVQARLRRA